MPTPGEERHLMVAKAMELKAYLGEKWRLKA